MTLSAEDLVVLALDRSDTERGYYYFHAKTSEAATRFTSASELPDAPRVVIALFATKTYSEGMGGGGSERSPEDRALTRSISSRFSGRTTVVLMSGSTNAGDAGPKGFVEFKPEMLRQAPDGPGYLEVFLNGLVLYQEQSDTYPCTRPGLYLIRDVTS